MSVDQQGIPDTTTDDQRMAPAPAVSPSPDMSQAPLNNPQSPATGTSPGQPPPAAQPAPAAPAQSPHQSMMNKILTMATGGDTYYTDPNGNRVKAPQSSATLGKTLIAATLAGLLSKDEYTQTPYGPRRDFSGTGANAVAASQGVVDKMRNAPQKLSNEAQTQKMLTTQNNASLIALQSAQVRLANEKNEYKIKTQAHVDEMNKPFKDYEELRTANNDPSQPKAFLDGMNGLSNDQVLKSGHKLTDVNVIQDGWVDKWDAASNRMVPEPTYGMLNPALKEVNLPKTVTDVLNKVNSQWKDIHDIVGGDVKIPVNAYVSAMHDYQAVQTGYATLDILNKTVNGKDAKPLSLEDVETAARTGRDTGANILPALYSLTHAVAGNNLPEESQRPDNLLHTLVTAGNGQAILKLIGLTPEQAMKKADGINAERTSQLALAKMGGIGDKAPAPDGMVENQLQTIQNSNLDADVKKTLIAGVPETSGGRSTTRQAISLRKDVETALAAKNREDIQAGNPQVLEKSANNMIEGDNSSIKDLMTSRSNVKATMSNTLQDEARKRGLDPTRYTLETQKAKSELFETYSVPKGTSGVANNLISFGKLLGHVNEGIESSQAWTRSGSPLLNHGIGWLAENAQNDQDFKRFQAEIIAPAKEYMNFLNQNRAEHESDIKSLESVINPATTPAGVLTALTAFAKTADIQAAQYGKKYLQTVGTTYPVVDPTGVAILDRLLGKGNSQAAKVSATIPRGWQNSQATPMNLATYNTIFAAADKDANIATRIAKENGWLVPNQKPQQ